jgi:hypothetical protein
MEKKEYYGKIILSNIKGEKGENEY